VVVAVDKGSQVLLEGCVLIDRLATNGGWLGGVAGAAAKGDLEAGLANIVEAHLEGDADVAFGAGNHVSETEGKAGRDLAEVDASASVQRVCVAADVVLPVQGDGAAGGDQRGGEDAIVVGEDEQRAEAKASVKREPVEGGMAGLHAEVDGDVGSLLLKCGGVGEEARSGTEVESSR